ncbi:MAG: PIN domain-containing protein [Treponema sp.]|jgi:predicted nucleic-acid-binding protein|nr:PIN domain-containing protein [Treponema sp.]
MVLLIDTNLIIDYIAEREQFKSAADKVFDAIFEDKAKGCLAAHSVTNMWYILRKVMSAEKRRDLFLALLGSFDVISLDKEKLISALKRKNFTDFEDCLQDECALSVHADYIVTRNKKDFAWSKVTALSPEEVLEVL